MSTIDETIVSEIYFPYYFKAVCGAILFSWAAGYMGYHCLLGNFAHPGQAYGLTALVFAANGIYYYFFSKSWKRTTVTPTEIIIDYWVLKKQQRIPYTAIKSIDTYRMAGSNTSIFGRYGQSFVMELNNGTTVTFSENYYDNYSKLTMAIYLHKYGPGHGRERYLERHGG